MAAERAAKPGRSRAAAGQLSPVQRQASGIASALKMSPAGQQSGFTKTFRDCLRKTVMEEPNRDHLVQRDVILFKLCCDHVTLTNLVEVLRSLVALTDPQEGKLTQSQEKALNVLGIWKTTLGAVSGPAPKTSVE